RGGSCAVGGQPREVIDVTGGAGSIGTVVGKKNTETNLAVVAFSIFGRVADVFARERPADQVDGLSTDVRRGDGKIERFYTSFLDADIAVINSAGDCRKRW